MKKTIPTFLIYKMLIIITHANDSIVSNYILDRDIGGCQTSRLRNCLVNMKKWYGFKRRGNNPQETFSIFNRRIIILVRHGIDHV